MADNKRKVEARKTESKRWDWEQVEKKTAIIQHVVLVVAAIFGGLWAVNQFLADGKNVSGPSIVVSAKQQSTSAPPYLINVNVRITGADRRGYYYDFNKAFLSVIKVSYEATETEPELVAIARLTPETLLITEDGQIGGTVSQKSHIASYRKGGYTFLVPVGEPGTYLATFAMPSSGVLYAKSRKAPEIDTIDPRVLGGFAGELESVYISIKVPESASRMGTSPNS